MNRRYRDQKVEKEKDERQKAKQERSQAVNAKPHAFICDVCGKEGKVSLIQIGRTVKLCDVHYDGAIGTLEQYIKDEKDAGVQPKSD